MELKEFFTRNKKFTLILLSSITALGLGIWWFNYNGGFYPCLNVTNGVLHVRGASMLPMIRSGDQLKHRIGYYGCKFKSVERDDLVTFRFPGRDTIVVKRVVGVPGDRFEYKRYKLFVNGEQLQNSAGNNYVIQSKMLELYARDYPVIPVGNYLVLGDNRKGALDSSRFGYLGHDQIVGKAEK